MMKKKRFFAGLIFLLFSLNIFSIELMVDYIEGFVDVKDGSEWVELYTGDSLNENSVIRLDQESLAEMSGGNSKLTITNSGTYKIADLLKASGNQDSINLGSMLSSKFKTMFKDGSEEVQSEVGGVRAAEVETDDGVDWMSSETEELILSGKDYLSRNLLDEALSVFEESYDFAVDEDEEAEALFYAGYTCILMDNIAGAIKNLNMIYYTDPYMEIYNDIYILKGQLLVETFAYENAISWLDMYEENSNNNEKEDRQTIYLLKGISYKELGQTGEARRILEKAVSIDGSSDIGTAARNLLGMM